MSIVIRLPAEIDIEEAAEELGMWKTTAPRKFRARLAETLDKLERLPLSNAPYETTDLELQDLRAQLIRKDFGYLVFYRPVPDGIIVMRVVHSSRNIEAIFG